MNKQDPQKIALHPFQRKKTSQDCRINVIFSINNAVLQVVFDVTARLDDLAIPEFEPSKAQRSGSLWGHTCFEIFLGKEGRQEYWEFNLSPSGDWNVWSFSGYRQGMQPEPCFQEFPFEVQVLSESELRVVISIDLSRLSMFSGLNAGFSVVLEEKNGEKSYWALSHPGKAPDFHAGEGWVKIRC